MSARSTPANFARGVGLYSPWKRLPKAVRQSQTRQAPTRKFRWMDGDEAKEYRRKRVSA